MDYRSPSFSCSTHSPSTHIAPGDDNGSAGHGSSGSTNLSGSRGSRVSTRDPLTRDQVNKIPRTADTAQLKPQRQFNSVVSTEYFVAVMMFDFESTSS